MSGAYTERLRTFHDSTEHLSIIQNTVNPDKILGIKKENVFKHSLVVAEAGLEHATSRL